MTTSRPDLDQLLGRLDLPAKVRLLTGASMFSLAADDRVGLVAMDLSDGPTGVRGVVFAAGVRSALLPNATLLASSLKRRQRGSRPGARQAPKCGRPS